MSLLETDNSGNLWFISSEESNKNFEIKDDRRVQLFFMNNSDSQYLSVYGMASIYKDKSTIEEKNGLLWQMLGLMAKTIQMFPLYE